MPNLISIFIDTEKSCKTDKTLISAIENTIKNQYIVKSDSDIKHSDKSHRFDAPAQIIVSPKRSFEAAGGYKDKKVCVLNFASATHPGGGVQTGAGAQEECLCRCSTLYFAISQKNITEEFHQKHRRLIREGKMNSTYNDDCIYSPAITVFKADTKFPEPIPPSEWYNVDVITCAAPNLSVFYKSSFIGKKEIRSIHRSRSKRILDIAKSEKEDVLILGAFGCGAFRNPPDIVSEVWREVLKDYIYDFETIEFAVVSSEERPSKNYTVFRNTFQNGIV